MIMPQVIHKILVLPIQKSKQTICPTLPPHTCNWNQGIFITFKSCYTHCTFRIMFDASEWETFLSVRKYYKSHRIGDCIVGPLLWMVVGRRFDVKNRMISEDSPTSGQSQAHLYVSLKGFRRILKFWGGCYIGILLILLLSSPSTHDSTGWIRRWRFWHYCGEVLGYYHCSEEKTPEGSWLSQSFLWGRPFYG